MPQAFLNAAVPALALLALAGTGCEREQIRAYEVPKEPPAAQASANRGAVPGLDHLPPMPGLAWTRLPEGWTSKGPEGIRAGTFSVASVDGKPGELSVIPLPGLGGSDLELVNLWRRQLALAPIAEAELAAHTEAIAVAGTPAKLFEIVGPADTAAGGNRMVVVALPHEGTTWFFKLAGEAAVVAANRDKLKAFLEVVSFTGAARPELAATRPAAASTTAGGPKLPAWTVPAGWEAAAPTPMVLSRWTLSGEGGAKAEVTVSAFPGDVGGLLANVNRWRGQVGLGALSAAELPANTAAVETPAGPATLVDFRGTDAKTGQPARLIAAVMPHGGQSWFYKLLGADALAEQQKAAFVQFVQSAKYAGG